MVTTTATNGKTHAQSAAAALNPDDLHVRNDFAAAGGIPRTSAASSQRKLPRKRIIFGGILAIVVAGAATAGVLFALHARHYESTDDATVEGRVISIGPQVAARVKSVLIADNQLVHKGEVLVELDPTDYQVAIEQAHATESAARGRLAQAQAEVESARASRDQAKAEVAVAEANAGMAASDHQRYEDAAHNNAGSISRQQIDNATGAWRSTEAQVQQARAKLAAAEAQITTAQAAVQGAQGDVAKALADVRRADVNLSYCTLTAPEEGRITKKSVEPGSYVQAGQNLFAIVPQDFWVVANFKETQLDRVRPGQPVNISVDSYPDREFAGHVESIQSGTGSRFSILPPENATGNYVKVVQRVPVRIVFEAGQIDDVQHPLGPGMSAVPEVKVR